MYVNNIKYKIIKNFTNAYTIGKGKRKPNKN